MWKMDVWICTCFILEALDYDLMMSIDLSTRKPLVVSDNFQNFIRMFTLTLYFKWGCVWWSCHTVFSGLSNEVVFGDLVLPFLEVFQMRLCLVILPWFPCKLLFLFPPKNNQMYALMLMLLLDPSWFHFCTNLSLFNSICTGRLETNTKDSKNKAKKNNLNFLHPLEPLTIPLNLENDS